MVHYGDRDTPVVNLRGERLFNSWSDIFRERPMLDAPLYSFNRRNVFEDNIWSAYCCAFNIHRLFLLIRNCCGYFPKVVCQIFAFVIVIGYRGKTAMRLNSHENSAILLQKFFGNSFYSMRKTLANIMELVTSSVNNSLCCAFFDWDSSFKSVISLFKYVVDCFTSYLYAFVQHPQNLLSDRHFGIKL